MVNILHIYPGFKDGFDIGCRGPLDRQDVSDNIPFTVGDEMVLWKKVMDEVKVHRFAGPYEKIPFRNFIQSPIGLVPKAGNKTRLIFHLSYTFKNGNKSLNYSTPEELSSVHYNDLDSAVWDYIQLMKELGVDAIYFAKSDLKSAFCILGIKPGQRFLLVMKTKDPITKKWYFFIDKCLPFGASISCTHFQRFSNALRVIVEGISGRIRHTLITNYLDDYLFIYFTVDGCNEILAIFLKVSKNIQFPVALEKTEWASPMIIFLGMLLDGRTFTISIPAEKRNEVLHMLQHFKDKKKATMKELQRLAGHLNFLHRAIVPGRAFTRRMYSKFAGGKLMQPSGRARNTSLTLKPHHHISLDQEFRLDCEMWELFLHDLDSVVRPFIDLNETVEATQIKFFSDASANPNLGYSVVFEDRWIFRQWEPNFVVQNEPSIEFLELFALLAGILTWDEYLTETRMILFCDNMSVVHMVNNSSSKCGQYMKLIRLLTLNNLKFNRRIFVRHI